MPVGLEERVDLAETHLVDVFMDERTVRTLLSLDDDAAMALAASAREGSLGLSDLGLERQDVEDAVIRLGTPSLAPQADAVRAAYMTLAANRERVLDAVAGAAPGMRP